MGRRSTSMGADPCARDADVEDCQGGRGCETRKCADPLGRSRGCRSNSSATREVNEHASFDGRASATQASPRFKPTVRTVLTSRWPAHLPQAGDLNSHPAQFTNFSPSALALGRTREAPPGACGTHLRAAPLIGARPATHSSERTHASGRTNRGGRLKRASLRRPQPSRLIGGPTSGALSCEKLRLPHL